MATTKFSKEQEDHQIDWRSDFENIPKENLERGKYKYKGEEHYAAHIFPENKDWIEWQIETNTRQNLKEYLQEQKKSAHSGKYNLKSSWIFCSNVYFPIRYNDILKKSFIAFLDGKGIKIKSIDDVILESTMTDFEIKDNPFKETTGNGQTTPDIAFVCTAEDYTKVIIVVENKYAENTFGHWSAATCQKYKAKFPDCTEETLCLIDKKNGTYQLFRQQAFAEVLLDNKKADIVYSAVAYHTDNTSLIKHLTNYEKKIYPTLETKSRFIQFTHQDWVNFVNENKTNDTVTEKYLKYLEERYGL